MYTYNSWYAIEQQGTDEHNKVETWAMCLHNRRLGSNMSLYRLGFSLFQVKQWEFMIIFCPEYP